jgi:uncharacterized protein
MSRLLFGIALFLLQCLGALAIDVPTLETRVTDLAGILSPEQKVSLEAKLQAFERSDSTQLAVLIIPSLQGESLEGYSIRVAEAWKIGHQGRDNGAILLISMEDRAIRIEVGYGLESNLTDARTGQILRNDFIPRFKRGDYYGGIDAAVTAMIESVRGVYQGNPEEESRPSRRPASGRMLHMIIVLLFPLLWILSATGKWGGGILGAGAGMLLPYTLISHSVVLILIGGVVGTLLGMFMGAIVRAGGGPGSTGGPFFWGGGGFGGGGFGGGGGGGFSGGGGGFGGGGSSGRW